MSVSPFNSCSSYTVDIVQWPLLGAIYNLCAIYNFFFISSLVWSPVNSYPPVFLVYHKYKLGTHEASHVTSQGSMEESALFHIHELTDTCNWLVLLWLAGERLCHPSHPDLSRAPLALSHGWLWYQWDSNSWFPNDRVNTFLLLHSFFFFTFLHFSVMPLFFSSLFYITLTRIKWSLKTEEINEYTFHFI